MSAGPLLAPPIPNPTVSARGRVVVSRLVVSRLVVSRLVESVSPGPMRTPTLLSLARIAAHVVRSSAATVCACATVEPAQMYNAPYTNLAYVFDIRASLYRRSKNNGVQHLCLSREGRAFCNSRRVSRSCRPVCRDAWRKPVVAPSPRNLSMRTAPQNLLTSAIAIAAFIPAITAAQVRPQTTARGPGAGQPWQCNPTDSLRALNRALRADSLARQRAAGGAVPGTQEVRSEE